MRTAKVLTMTAGLTMTVYAVAVATTVRVGDAVVQIDPGPDQCSLDEKAGEAD